MSDQHSFLNLRTGAATLGLAAVVACGAGMAPAMAVDGAPGAAATASTTSALPASTPGHYVAQNTNVPNTRGFVWVQDGEKGYGLTSDGTLVHFGGKLPDGLGGIAAPGEMFVYKTGDDGTFYQFSARVAPTTLGEAYKSIGKAYPAAAQPSPSATTPAKTAPAQAAPAKTAPSAPAKNTAPAAQGHGKAATGAAGTSAQGAPAQQSPAAGKSTAAQGTEAPKGELARTGLTTQGKFLAVAGAAAVALGAGMLMLRRRFSAGA